MEYIAGKTPLKLSNRAYEPEGSFFTLQPPKDLDVGKTLDVFPQVIRGMTEIEHVGVFHENPTCSNVIVRPAMVDFGTSRVWRYTERRQHLAQAVPRPLHPAIRYTLGGFDSFAGWFPKDWLREWNEELARDIDEEPSQDSNDQHQLRWEKWAMETFKDEDFTMAEESEAIAIQRKQVVRPRLRKLKLPLPPLLPCPARWTRTPRLSPPAMPAWSPTCTSYAGCSTMAQRGHGQQLSSRSEAKGVLLPSGVAGFS